jgi:hypothetical protein
MFIIERGYGAVFLKIVNEIAFGIETPVSQPEDGFFQFGFIFQQAAAEQKFDFFIKQNYPAVSGDKFFQQFQHVQIGGELGGRNLSAIEIGAIDYAVRKQITETAETGVFLSGCGFYQIQQVSVLKLFRCMEEV